MASSLSHNRAASAAASKTINQRASRHRRVSSRPRWPVERCERGGRFSSASIKKGPKSRVVCETGRPHFIVEHDEFAEQRSLLDVLVRETKNERLVFSSSPELVTAVTVGLLSKALR